MANKHCLQCNALIDNHALTSPDFCSDECWTEWHDHQNFIEAMQHTECTLRTDINNCAGPTCDDFYICHPEPDHRLDTPDSPDDEQPTPGVSVDTETENSTTDTPQATIHTDKDCTVIDFDVKQIPTTTLHVLAKTINAELKFRVTIAHSKGTK